MLKIDKNYIETDRAITDINCVTHISWGHIEDGVYEVKIHFIKDHDLVTQDMSKNDLERLKDSFKNRKVEPPIEWRESSNANFQVKNRRINLSLEDGILTKDRTWAADLAAIEFLTWRQDEESLDYMVKLHTGNKFVKVWLNDKEEINEMIEIWKRYR